jgi:hypothetical protein
MTAKGFVLRSKLDKLLCTTCAWSSNADLSGNPNFVFAVLRNKKRFEGKQI